MTTASRIRTRAISVARPVPPSGTMTSPAPTPTVRDTADAALDSRWLLDIPQACRALHQSRAGIFRLLAAGKLGPSVKIGRRRLLPVTAIESYIARLIAEEGGDAA